MQRRDARVTESADVFRTRTPARGEVAIVLALLRVGDRSSADRKHGRAGKNGLPHGNPPMAILMPPTRGAPLCLSKLKFGQRLIQRNVGLRKFITSVRRESQSFPLSAAFRQIICSKRERTRVNSGQSITRTKKNSIVSSHGHTATAKSVIRMPAIIDAT